MINLKKKREIDFKKTNLSKKIIFCEGSTEYNYLEYFKIKLDKSNNKYASLEIETKTLKSIRFKHDEELIHYLRLKYTNILNKKVLNTLFKISL